MTSDPERLERGRKIYDFSCYVCHGYNGDARTQAASYLAPRPRDFTATPDLDLRRITRAVRLGRPGTAMKGFAGILGEAEINDVAAFVEERFVRHRAPERFYHTAENGWPDHERRYRAAYPFVLAQLGADRPSAEAGQRGWRLFRDSCITCHDTAGGHDAAVDWELPAQSPAAPSECGETAEDDDHHGAGYDREDLAYHDRPPRLGTLTAAEREGERLYQQACAYCHAADGSGKNWIGEFLNPHPTDFTASCEIARLTDGGLRRAILDGLPRTSMPAFRTALDDRQVDAIVAYLRRVFLGPEAARGPAR